MEHAAQRWTALAAFADHFYLQAMRVASMNDGLPLVTLYLTERCNSRCVTCDYWRHGRKDVTLEAVTRLLPDLRALRTRTALISGGEPLLNPQWREIAETLRSEGIDLWLLTSGLSLFKHARPAAGLFKTVTVSLDGTCAETYTAIRGLDAFDKVCDGIRAASAAGVAVGLRITLQRANFRELPRFVTLAASWARARCRSWRSMSATRMHSLVARISRRSSRCAPLKWRNSMRWSGTSSAIMLTTSGGASSLSRRRK
jgi:molybdenum cofactor biosynthesis enzyme MoaA